MTNQTVTTNQTLEQVIAGGLLSGENITINGGAVVTMTQTNSVLLGRITINDGKLLIDGGNITTGNSINLVGEGCDPAVDETLIVNGQGTFEVQGAWVDVGTTNGTDNQIIDLSSTTGSSLWANDEFISWLPMIQIETGRRINYVADSGIPPAIGDWIRLSSDRLSSFGKIKEVGAGYVIVWAWYGNAITDGAALQVRSVVNNFGPDLQISWAATANGVDVKEAGVYTEFGNSRTNGINTIASFNRGVGGMVFDHAFQDTFITLGSSALGKLGGFKPPSGCNIRVPNVMLSSSTIANFNLGLCTAPASNNETDWYALELSAGGSVDLNIANLCSFYAVDNQAFAFDANFVGATVGLGSASCGNRVSYNHCVIVRDPTTTANSGYTNVFTCVDSVQGADITFCMVITASDIRCPIGADTSIDVNVTDCIISMSGQNTISTAAVYGYHFNRTTTFSIVNCVFVGSDSTQQDDSTYLNTSSNGQIKNFMFSCTQDETQQSNEVSMLQAIGSSNNLEIIGIEVIGAGMMGDMLIKIVDSSSIKVRAIGMIDDKMDFGSTDAEYAVQIVGLCNDLDFARIWKDCTGTVTEELITIPTTSKNIIVCNCSGKYASELQPSGGDNIRFKGVHGGAGSFGGATGWEDVYIVSYGNNFHDGFQSDTRGTIACLMITPSNSTSEVTVVAGNPKFYKDGDLDMQNGDIIEFECGYFIKGHTGFTGVFNAASGTSSWDQDEWANVQLEFQWMLDGGAWSAWANVRTTFAWTLLTGIEVGVKLKYRFTATGSALNMSGLMIETTTTLQAQKDNMYPIDQLSADIIVNVTDEDTGLVNDQARVHVTASGGGALVDGTPIIDRQVVNGLGTVIGTVNAVPQDFVGLVVDAQVPARYVPKPISGTITESGITINVGLVSDE